MATVFLMWHVYEMPDTGDDETKFIGVYSSQASAEHAAARLRTQPGFNDYPDKFEIHEYTVDESDWREGFVTVQPDEI